MVETTVLWVEIVASSEIDLGQVGLRVTGRAINHTIYVGIKREMFFFFFLFSTRIDKESKKPLASGLYALCPHPRPPFIHTL